MNKYDNYLSDIKRLHEEGKRNFEISKETGIDSRRISELLKSMGLKSNTRIFNESVTDLQHEVFISCAIGDGSIFKSERNKNYRMNLAHSEKQKEYFMLKYNIVKDFIGVDYTFNKGYDKRTRKYYYHYKFQSKVNPYFTRLRRRFYKKGKKIIPKNLMDDITPRILAYKFFDDGFKSNHGYLIAMDDYDDLSIENFMNIMLCKFGIKTNFHKSGMDIYIPANQKDKFKEIVLPYATQDVLYKLGELLES